MAKINLNIEAESAKDLQETLAALSGIYSTGTQGSSVEEVATKVAPEPEPEKKQPAKRKTTPKKAAEKAETASSLEGASSEKPSSTGTSGTDSDPEKETSATVGQYPDATLDDVKAAMKKAQADGKLTRAKQALSRQNVTKLSELAKLQETQEDAFSVFLTDLEVLTAGE